MSSAAPKTTSQSRHLTAQEMAARLPRRFLAVLACVALLLVLDQAVLQPLLLQVSLYAPTINVAGRQRMLSQRLSKAALQMQSAGSGDEFREMQRELAAALEQWTRAHRGLLDGDASLDLPPTRQPAVREQFSRLASHFQQIAAAAGALRQLDAPGAADDEPARDAVKRQVGAILEHETPYLETMERIVGLYQQEAQNQVLLLRLLGLGVTGGIIVLMVALAWFVLRPANRMILQQVQQLEDRVAERTSQLTKINRALKREIRERQQAEQRTRQLSGQLAHASRVTAMGQLATGLAHEINQPLAAITNYAESCALLLTQEPSGAAEAQSGLRRIRQAALRAGQIVRRMRSFVRPPANETEARLMDVNELIGEVGALCQSELVGADVALRLELSPDLPAVPVDPIRIQQVLVNLIQNAVQAMKHSPRENRRLAVRTTPADDGLRVEVADNGPGFIHDEMQAAFAPFYTTRSEGLGLGLSISRGIIEEHGGKLWADGHSAMGATVCFTLPASRSDGANIEHDAHSLCR